MALSLRLLAVSLLMLVLACTTLIGGGCEHARAIERAASALDVPAASYDMAREESFDADVDAGRAMTVSSASFVDHSAPYACTGLTSALFDTEPSDDLDKELMTWNAVVAPLSVARSTHDFADPVLARAREMSYFLLRPPQA